MKMTVGELRLVVIGIVALVSFSGGCTGQAMGRGYWVNLNHNASLDGSILPQEKR